MLKKKFSMAQCKEARRCFSKSIPYACYDEKLEFLGCSDAHSWWDGTVYQMHNSWTITNVYFYVNRVQIIEFDPYKKDGLFDVYAIRIGQRVLFYHDEEMKDDSLIGEYDVNSGVSQYTGNGDFYKKSFEEAVRRALEA
jgi:hypothetical protein